MIKIVLPIVLPVLYTAGLLFAGSFSKKLGITISNNSYINKQVNYQTLLLVITGISLLTTYLISKENFLTYFSFGQVFASGEGLKFFGIKQGDSWIKTGLSLCIVITGITTLFMYFQLKKIDIDWSLLKTGILWILLFSLINSFGEEMIYRIGIISPLKGLLSPVTLFLVSGVIFGLAHIKGMPSGIIGISLAGLLGFVLAKSVYETQGFFWAWTIHFLQDVVIIGSLYLIHHK